MTTRRIPIFNRRGWRIAAGLLLALLSPILAAYLLDQTTPGVVGLVLFVVVVWLPASWLTDKYVHKYPQRYDTYLLASHLKAALIMAIALGGLGLVAGPGEVPSRIFWSGLLLFILGDGLLSLPRRTAPAAAERTPPAGSPTQAGSSATDGPANPAIDSAAILARIGAESPAALADMIRQHLPNQPGGIAEVLILDDLDAKAPAPSQPTAGLLVGRTPLNYVNRLNIFLGQCSERVVLGGYLAVSYIPLEEVLHDLRRRYPGPLYWPAYLLHFAWYRAIPKLPWLDRLYFSPSFAWFDRLMLRSTRRRNRALPKAEAWGRLAFWGFEVVAESEGEGNRTILAQRVSPPVANRRPSYYAVVALEKVGLDGKLIRLHKVRSMYPFSEFLQRRLYQSHGLTATGKFKDDFRLTEYGKLIRRHWIDELPGLFDWLRGEIKLVGMRATSPQFLSTYPQEVYDLYIQIKPGLVPPIFDEKTNGFADIVRIEMEYLRRYHEAPVRTDIAYFWYTFRDIIFRKVRSH